MKINRIITKIYDSNTFVVEKADEVVIIDAGGEIKKVKELVGNKRVLGVLLTHGHYDHSAYCKEYAKEFACPIFAHQEATNTMSDSRAFYSENDGVIDDFTKFSLLQNDGILNLGDFTIKYFTTKGHSPCSVCYQIDDALFAGDTLFENGIGRTDLVGSDKKQMLKSLQKLENLAFTQVYSGHGEASDAQTQQKNISIFKRFLAR